jgi:hypothetical protein
MARPIVVRQVVIVPAIGKRSRKSADIACSFLPVEKMLKRFRSRDGFVELK